VRAGSTITMEALLANIWLTCSDASSLTIPAASAHDIDDAVPGITLLLHDTHPPPSLGHQKRVSGSRRMDDCSNPPSHFFSSYCKGVDYPIQSRNPLSVQVNCNNLTPTRNWTDPTPDYNYETFCRDDEICVTQEDVHNPWLEDTEEAEMAGDTLVDVAWCVGRDQFVAIAQGQLEHTTKPDVFAAPYHSIDQGTRRDNVSVQATLVHTEGHSAFAKILIEAQAPGLVSGQQVWHTLIGGANVCNHCSRLELKSVPSHTHRMLVHIILPFAVPNALLYLSRHVT